MNGDLTPPDDCANCGAPIPRGAKSCPECGADEKTGWRETSVYDGVELPPEPFEESPVPMKNEVNGIAWYWWLVAVALLFAAGSLLLRVFVSG